MYKNSCWLNIKNCIFVTNNCVKSGNMFACDVCIHSSPLGFFWNTVYLMAPRVLFWILISSRRAFNKWSYFLSNRWISCLNSVETNSKKRVTKIEPESDSSKDMVLISDASWMFSPPLNHFFLSFRVLFGW